MAPEPRDDLVRVLLVEDDEDDSLLARGLLRRDAAHPLRARVGADLRRRRASDRRPAPRRLPRRLPPRRARRPRADAPHARQRATTRRSSCSRARTTRTSTSWRRELGVDDYLVKGRIDAPLLERSIRYALEQQRERVRALRESEERYALAVARRQRRRVGLGPAVRTRSTSPRAGATCWESPPATSRARSTTGSSACTARISRSCARRSTRTPRGPPRTSSTSTACAARDGQRALDARRGASRCATPAARRSASPARRPTSPTARAPRRSSCTTRFTTR